MSYEQYFNIASTFHPVVDEEAIRKNPELWKAYYPHETFVALLKHAVQMLDGTVGNNLWVQGAYGTGKSHAVLTLHRLLSLPEEDVRGYFEKYPKLLHQDLFKRLMAVKQNSRLLLVQRSGSSEMDSRSLLFAVRDSIERALKQAGYATEGMVSLKDAVLNYLRNENMRPLMEVALQKCADLFYGETPDSLIKRLQEYEGKALIELLHKLDVLSKRCGLVIFELDHESLCQWIQEVVDKNHLTSIVFFWDEFSEFFSNNSGHLTGFQEIAQLSNTGKFHFVIVTHAADNLYVKKTEDGRKLADRFRQCIIDLPENMAFRLLGDAMKVTEDSALRTKWQERILPRLVHSTESSRRFVQQKANIDEQELNDILPIHPYAALVLKHIAKTYASNQRSMFDFVCSRDSDAQGFRWFIHEVDPVTDYNNSLLTLDRLWQFFYEKGRNNLAPEVRDTLSAYERHKSQLNDSQAIVLKVVLLLEALSRSVADVDYLLPSQSNIRLALEGSALENTFQTALLSLVRQNILWEKPFRANEKSYTGVQNIQDQAALREKKKQVEDKPTEALFTDDASNLSSIFTWTTDLKNRYAISFAAEGNFSSQLNRAKSQVKDGKLAAVVCIARNSNEQSSLRKKIQEAAGPECPVVLVDATYTLMDHDVWLNYVENQAQGLLYLGNNRAQATGFLEDAKRILNAWFREISKGRFCVYSRKSPEGIPAQSLNSLSEMLRQCIGDFYPQALELWGCKVTETLWIGSSLALGVKCGVEGVTSGLYKAAQPALRPENFIQDAWSDEKFLKEAPTARISQLTKKVRAYVERKFKENGGISIRDLLQYLRRSEYGFLPCNVSAFILGFILRPYTKSTYQCSDGATSTPMSTEVLGNMIKEAMQNSVKDKQLRSMSEEVRAFIASAADVFALDASRCATIDLARNLIQTKMKSYRFPIWVLEKLSPAQEVMELIHLYVGLVNSANYGDGTLTDSDIANRIGSLCLAHTDVSRVLKALLLHCEEGMKQYLADYHEGALLSLAEDIHDDGAYLNRLADKFDAQEALWVWNKETAQKKIDELITEYEIVAATNKSLGCCETSYAGAMQQWFDKCNAVAISYAAAENHWGELKPLMTALREGRLKKLSLQRPDYKDAFLKFIREWGDKFKVFYVSPVSLFASVCRAELEGLDEQDIAEVYDQLPSDALFDMAKIPYMQVVRAAVTQYKQNMGISKLRAQWIERTGSASPRAWSREHQTPLLCLVPAEELKQAGEAMAVLETSHPERTKLEQADAYLSCATFFSKMQNPEECDAALLCSLCSRDSATLLRASVAELRKALTKNLGEEAFDWFPSNSKAEMLADELAEKVYRETGYKEAVSFLETMSPDELQKKLLAVVTTDMALGLALLNHKP